MIFDTFPPEKETMMRSLAKILIVALLATNLSFAAACGGGSTKTVTRTDAAGNETTVTETKEDHDSGGGPTGILSTTVNAIGFILALPFKIVGGLIEIIF